MSPGHFFQCDKIPDRQSGVGKVLFGSQFQGFIAALVYHGAEEWGREGAAYLLTARREVGREEEEEEGRKENRRRSSILSLAHPNCPASPVGPTSKDSSE